MKYVKFISKPDEWFKEGSEAFYEDGDYKCRRMTLEEYNYFMKTSNPQTSFVGIRVCSDNPNENKLGYHSGDERIDGEWCSFDEFEIEYTDEYEEKYN